MNPKISYLLCCCFIACQLFSLTAHAEPPAWPSNVGIGAEAGVVMDADSGTLLFEENGTGAYPPASITKLMTALIVLEHCSLNDTVTYSETAMNSVEADSGNKFSLQAGDQMSVEDCLHAMLLVSVNQSANALAEHTAGSIPAFVEMMNEKAAELGCSDKTHFDNPSGLNGETQQVTACDMALIAQAAFANEDLLRISSSLSYRIPSTIYYPDGFSFRQEHKLVVTDDPNNQLYYPPAMAGKTGYLRKAGNTLVTYAQKDGKRLISVVLKGSPSPQYFLDGKGLLEFGFQSFQNLSISQQESRYVTGNESIELNGNTYLAADLMVEPGPVVTLPAGASFGDAALALEPLPENAPANAVAVLSYTYQGHPVGKAFLLSKGTPVSIDPSSPEDASKTGSGQGAGLSDGNGQAEAGFPLPALIAVALAIFAVAFMAMSITWIAYSRRKEARDLARRREMRRRRLRASGEEAEFERLMELRRKRGDPP